MKKIKGKLVKRSSQTQLQVNYHSSADWTKYDERLIECVESGDLEKLRVTLGKKGTSAVKVDPNGTTALHTACLKGSVECLDVLLEEQPDLSSVDKLGKFTVLLKRELRSHWYCTLNLEKNLELYSCLQCMSLKNKLWFMYLSLHVHDCGT